jgi:hypothetical protein
MGIAVRRPEYMEMGIATQRRRGEERLDITIDGQSEISIRGIGSNLSMLLAVGQRRCHDRP